MNEFQIKQNKATNQKPKIKVKDKKIEVEKQVFNLPSLIPYPSSLLKPLERHGHKICMMYVRVPGTLIPRNQKPPLHISLSSLPYLSSSLLIPNPNL